VQGGEFKILVKEVKNKGGDIHKLGEGKKKASPYPGKKLRGVRKKRPIGRNLKKHRPTWIACGDGQREKGVVTRSVYGQAKSLEKHPNHLER